jgi:cytoskeletal protein RodZ|tara:strand:+ start:100 stop:927 length:828 start_codon:yes stop_codon:yes gene_type:complete
MAQFYKELMELRESRGISLEEIQDRTKINIKYLEAIEQGDFKILPVPYLRLFLRAYAEEIGGDSQRALEQMDSFLGTTRVKIRMSQVPKEGSLDDSPNTGLDKEIFSESNKKLRQDLIKGGVLLIAFIFAILIFRKIFNQESAAIVTDTGPVMQERVSPLSESDLIKNYIETQSSEELLSVTPPYFVKLITRDQTAFSFTNETSIPENKVLQANYEYDLGAFVDLSKLLFSSSNGLTIFINGTEIQGITNYNYPIQLTIKPNPPALLVQRYKPLQ